MAGIAIGAVGLGISVTDHAIIVLGFIHDVVVDVKRFGDQVSAVRAQVMYEVARLQTISKYLNHQTPDGAYQLYTLDPACQSAVLGLVQELEVIFAAYTACVDKHNIAALRQGYAKSLEGGLGGLVLDSRLAEGANAQAASTTRERLRWAIFNKAKITKLLKSLGDWSDRIMNLLLCVVSLGNTAAGSSETGAASITPNEIDDVVVSRGLTLKMLMIEDLKQRQGAGDDTTLVVKDRNEDNRTARLLEKTTGGDLAPRGRVFFECKPYELRRRAKEPSEAVKQEVARLARLLSFPRARNTGFQTLQCVAVVKDELRPPKGAYVFAFELPRDLFPDDKDPVTLWQAISSGTLSRPTLEERFAMARCLVQTIANLHSVDWLHKSIRSENIIFGYHSSRQDYEHPLLVGFEFSRDEKDRSTTEQDDRLERNIYRHPDRQGPPEKRFNALHDIYSLGVVLLEIGLWRLAALFEEDYKDMEAEDIMRSLMEHATDRLPHYMGSGYTSAVLACMDGSLGTVMTQPSPGLSAAQRLEINLALLEDILGRIAWRGD